jgi:hypothetical protein
MNAAEELAAKRAALQFVHSSDIPPQHKGILLRVLTQSLREDHFAVANPTQQRPWLEAELLTFERTMRNKSASSWQHADELVMYVCGQLHRSPEEVRAKAIELGFAAAVDYRFVKAHARDASL